MRPIRLIPGLLALAMTIILGCGGTQPAGPPGPIASLSPVQQCQLVQTAAVTAETGVLFAKIKDPKTQLAVDAALAGVKAGAADYCDGVAAGRPPDALASFLAAFNGALTELNGQLRAPRAIASAGESEPDSGTS
jgi:hypothetical protein